MTSKALRPASLRVLVGGSFFLLLLGLAPPAGAQSDLRILVTNDDGIESAALKAMVLALAEIGDVLVAAPIEDHSYSGLSKTLPSGMLRVHEVQMPGAIAAFAVRGTPVDAVTWALLVHGQDEPFDAIVAGVNRGTTLGSEALSMGVVGAAIVGASYGIPSIAVAQDRAAYVYDVATGVTIQLLRKAIEAGLEGAALSVNVPSAATTRPRGIVIAPLGDPEYTTMGFKKVEGDNPQKLWRVQFKKNRRPERGTDLDWYQRGEITVTPIMVGVTASDLLETLEGWELVAERGSGR